jgi:hypothetical protein
MVKGRASIQGLAADIAEAELDNLGIFAGQRDSDHTRQFADLFAVRLELRTGSG